MLDLEGSIRDQREAQGVEVPGCVKTASDLARYRYLLSEVRPAWCVELGTYRGRSAQWLADTGECWVASVDTHPQIDAELFDHPSIAWLQGNSTDPAIVTLITNLVGDDAPVVVVCDSDHSADHVYAEMQSYAGLVSVGSYLVVEDGIVAHLPEQLVHYKNSSPLDAIERFLAERDDFAVDKELEDAWPTTQHPQGFLRRVR